MVMYKFGLGSKVKVKSNLDILKLPVGAYLGQGTLLYNVLTTNRTLSVPIAAFLG